ncbi:MAG: FkbM family methyltransferase [Pseudohongiellaceae bacterium]
MTAWQSMQTRLHLYRFLWNRRWLGRRIGRQLYKALGKHGQAPDAPFTTDFFGLRYQGNLRNSIEFNIFHYGAFEKPLLFFLRDNVLATANDQAVFCDIGANIGQHSLFLARHVAQVHAFEPYRPVSDKLRLQIELNHLTNIHIHDVGLSDQAGKLPFYAPTGRNQGIGSFDAGTVSKGNKAIGELELVRGDDYFKEQGIQRVDLMKIDVEGFEKPALAGLNETLRRFRPVIVCELSYGKALSFTSLDELQTALPPDYGLFTFDNRKADGSKARRQGAKARRSGQYRLIPFHFTQTQGQDDIVACPREQQQTLPLSTLGQEIRNTGQVLRTKKMA